ncbi:BREX-2 system adenine-specific DNA-methyltransferase PglX [Streptomyces viridosporus]|uniref:BREX-2 system adenine-specific DNA-methyltransferase PglX n=1 Tax=Streptomyces viridosporus TaxID=67581 RepID=UPI0002D3268D|nr:BREX-2 system adenine-specific DNA-methyltransferase PglX [Streptomyces viridosporus]
MTVTDAVEGAGSESGSGLNKEALLKDLKRQVVALEDDLRERSESVEEFRVRLRAEYDQAVEASRRARGTYGAWRDERVTQAAAAWVLACVFVRFCEDNGLIEEPFIAGPGERLVEAEERHEAFFREHPHLNNRDWLIAAFRHVAAANETAAGLFDEAHNPLWGLTPSYEAATELLGFWRRWGADGRIRHDFTDPEWDTRFLGDLYQDLSEHARKTYALLQTPEFVEEFILDLTLEPAVSEEEFGLDPVWVGPDGEERRGLRTIDPACGSGHFLLGIFRRLVEKWRAATPAADDWTVVRRALESVHGCDKNPFAVSVARFRLLVAAMKEAGARTLAEAPVFPINVAVGDSLLHGRGAAGIQGELDLFSMEGEGDGSGEAFAYGTEDVWEFARRVDLLGRGSYHVVVGNPPYITVKDDQEKKNYKAAYDACVGQYALSVPFAQRLFELAVRGSGGAVGGGGFVGQITANSFMKREFGRSLIERYFRERVELSHVIDTGGAYIPGHGTPTVILIGRNRVPSDNRKVRAVLGVRGEPSQPLAAADGFVWRAIVAQVGKPGSESEWISVDDLSRHGFATAPWSLSGGGVSEVAARLMRQCSVSLGDRVKLIGRTAHTGADDAYFAPVGTWKRAGVKPSRIVPIVEGTVVRDWVLTPGVEAIFPYNENLSADLSDLASMRILWRQRSLLRERREPGGTHEEIGLTWFEWSRWHPERFQIPLGISYAEVSTHNNFVLDRGEKVFKQTAPVIKLPREASEEEYLSLLGILNSSAASFWMKQNCHVKGGSGIGRGVQDELWEARYAFNATRLEELPLPDQFPLEVSRLLDGLSRNLVKADPAVLCGAGTPTRGALDDLKAEFVCTRQRMIALQEELDWQVYGMYGLLSDSEVARTTVQASDIDGVPEVRLGERAFEIVLARRVARGEVKTAWFERHKSAPVTEVPDRWPDWYRNIVKGRISIIESRKDVRLIEKPEYKRRWSTELWSDKEKRAFRNWLLDRCEDHALWFSLRDGINQPRTLTVNQLADVLNSDSDVMSVAALYAADHLGKPDLPLAQVLADVVADEHVPYLAVMRFKDSGLRKRDQWEEVWELQREEDRVGQRLGIAAPPKYTSADFLKGSYWSNRGKLDVSKERFISYPEASPDGDSTLLLGWAGWNHKEQAQALVNLIEGRTTQGGWGTERILPFVAGLQEIMPWVKQWHGEYDAEWEGVPAEDCETYLEEQMAKHQLSAADLKAWRPVKKTRGRKAAASKKPTTAPEETALDAE